MLALDRTNWKFGQTNLNLLMLALVHQSRVYPLIWFCLDQAGFRRRDGEYVLRVSPTYEPAVLAQYRQRWGIETLFGALKTRGFNLEATHVTKADRLQKLVALLALTFCWCHRVGLWLQQQKASRKKKQGRLSQSIFRRGLDCLRRLSILGIDHNPLLWQQVLHLLSST